jgi:hypothetical protein
MNRPWSASFRLPTAVVRGRSARREADRAGAQALEQQPAHLADLGLGRDALNRRIAHHIAAQRRMTDEAGHVRCGAAAFEQVEILGHRFEFPADSRAQSVERHALDLGEVAHDALAVRRTAGRDGEAAVADHGRRDAEGGGGRGAGVPGELRVVVRVVVDDARHQCEAVGVDYLARALRAKRRAERCDPSVAHGDIAA